MNQSLEQKYSVAIDKFKALLASGDDHKAFSMYEEVGKVVFLSIRSIRKIVNSYYDDLITQEMISYCRELEGSHQSKVDRFAEEFNFCTRESRLIIGYIKYRDEQGRIKE